MPLAGHDRGILGLRKLRRFISIHMPLAGHDAIDNAAWCSLDISIHMPLAGHDRVLPQHFRLSQHFNPRAPCGARPEARKRLVERRKAISIHVPLAGHDHHGRRRDAPGA